jgi:hypothetical protein
VAKKYFTDQNRYVFFYLPESMRPASGSERVQTKGVFAK